MVTLGKAIVPVVPYRVLKEVIAIPGDTVIVTNKDMIVNDKHFWAPIQKRDRMGRAMVSKVVLNQPKRAYGYWLYGMNNPIYSWDSRYYGSIDWSYLMNIYNLLYAL